MPKHRGLVSGRGGTRSGPCGWTPIELHLPSRHILIPSFIVGRLLNGNPYHANTLLVGIRLPTRSKCAYCSIVKQRRYDSYVWCRQCGKALCVVGRDSADGPSCLERYHSECLGNSALLYMTVLSYNIICIQDTFNTFIRHRHSSVLSTML